MASGISRIFPIDFAAFEVAVRFARLRQRKRLEDDRSDRPLSSSGQTLCSTSRAIAPFSATDRIRSVEPVIVNRLCISVGEIELRFRSALQADLNQAAVDRQTLDVSLAEYSAPMMSRMMSTPLPAVEIADGLDEIHVAIVDRSVGTKPLARRALLLRAGGRVNGCAERHAPAG